MPDQIPPPPLPIRRHAPEESQSLSRGTAAITLLMLFTNLVTFLLGFLLALLMEDPQPVKFGAMTAVLGGPVLFLILFVGAQSALPPPYRNQ